ncbi:MAG: lytic transglycosylase domain-containing protein [Succinivibrio sp.]|nr:lytic transglycosylase domain-containing protein [Succinivibrio sp.]
MKRILLLLAAVLMLCLNTQAAEMQCHGKVTHWRDVAYRKAPMRKYADLRYCIAWTAYQFDLPEELMYAVLYVERGSVNGKCTRNRNGTQDCGPAQINDVRLKELQKFQLTREDVKSRPCHNIWAMGYLMRREIEKADGRIWRGVGNYHFNYSVNHKIHNRYVKRVMAAWQKLNKEVQAYCSE